MNHYIQGQRLVLIGFRDFNVGSRVLEQLILGDYKYDGVVVADSKYVVPNLVSTNDMLRVLHAKRNGNGLDSLGIELDTSNNLLKYIRQGDIVINAMPTIFLTNGSARGEKIASVVYDAKFLRKGSHVVPAHKCEFGNPDLYREVINAATESGAMYVPAGVLMGPTRAAEVLSWLKDNGIKVASAQGIVNGTTNNMLLRMSNDGIRYEDALQEQIGLEHAEKPDGKNDVQGHDALTKIRVPAFIFGNYNGGELFGLEDGRSNLPISARRMVSGNGHRGIEGITTELLQELRSRSLTIKLVGSYDGSTGIVAVGPVVLPVDSPLAQIGTDNILVLNLERKVNVIMMMNDIYGELTKLQADKTENERYVMKIDYKKMLPGNPPASDSFLIKVIYNPKTNQLAIKGPGAGSAETAAGLLGAADRIRRKVKIRNEPMHLAAPLQDAM